MGRLLGVLVVSAVFVPFFAVAGQVDQAGAIASPPLRPRRLFT